MDPQFQELSERIAKDVSAAVSRDVTAAVTANLTDVLKAAEQRLSGQATIHAEAVREQAKLAAEGYAATLEGINRRLDGIEKAVNVKLRDHDNALANHAGRIAALEPKHG